jgi:hypothetical protein
MVAGLVSGRFWSSPCFFAMTSLSLASILGSSDWIACTRSWERRRTRCEVPMADASAR